MSTGFFKVPKAKNEIVKSYRPGSPERKEVIETYQKMISSRTFFIFCAFIFGLIIDVFSSY